MPPITIADLIVKLRPDSSDAKKEVREVKAELGGVTDAAAKAQSGVSRFLGDAQEQLKATERLTLNLTSALQTVGATGTDGAALTQRLVQAEQTAAVARRLEGAARLGGVSDSVASSTVRQFLKDMEEGGKNTADSFSLSNTQLIRMGAGLAGVSLGLNLAAGFARQMHEIIEGIVNSQLSWEQSLRSSSGVFGEMAPKALAVAQEQASLPGVAGSNQAFLQANVQASYLTNRYGVFPGSSPSTNHLRWRHRGCPRTVG